MINEVLDTGMLIAKAADSATDTVAKIASKIDSWNRIREETSSMMRLLYIEVCRDLELLSVLVDKSEKNIQWDDPRIRFFTDNFETAIMELVLMGNKNEDVFKKLSRKGRITERNDIEGVKGKNIQKYENVMQALRFVYVKIDILRKLVKADGENTLLKKVKMLDRLKNIEERLVLAKRILGDVDEIKSIS